MIQFNLGNQEKDHKFFQLWLPKSKDFIKKICFEIEWSLIKCKSNRDLC